MGILEETRTTKKLKKLLNECGSSKLEASCTKKKRGLESFRLIFTKIKIFHRLSTTASTILLIILVSKNYLQLYQKKTRGALNEWRKSKRILFKLSLFFFLIFQVSKTYLTILLMNYLQTLQFAMEVLHSGNSIGLIYCL